MIIKDKVWVLQSFRNPISFLDNSLKKTNDFLMAARAGNKKTAEALLEEYNRKTLHDMVEDYRVVEVNVSYEL